MICGSLKRRFAQLPQALGRIMACFSSSLSSIYVCSSLRIDRCLRNAQLWPQSTRRKLLRHIRMTAVTNNTNSLVAYTGGTDDYGLSFAGVGVLLHGQVVDRQRAVSENWR